MSQHFQSVVSIGPQCLTSSMLQRAELKAFSGPFDWIFSSIDMVCDCIESDFADLLNIDYLKPIPEHRRPDPSLGFANHLLYRERYGLDAIFNHYDPRQPERYAYFRRCVKRMRAVLAAPRPQLLIAMAQFEAFQSTAIARLFHLLDDRAPNVAAWIIAAAPPDRAQSLVLTETRGRHAIYEFVGYSTINGIRFGDERDNGFIAAQLRSMIDLDSRGIDFSL